MLSHHSWKPKLTGFILILSVFLSVYATFVYVADGVIWHQFVKSVSLRTVHDSKEGFEYAMGDVLVVSATMKGANVYFVRVYDGNCSIFEESGGITGSEAVVCVPLCPPVFKGGRVYSVVFQGGLVNCPLLGSVASSSLTTVFSVSKGLAQLKFNSSYVKANNELRLQAFLATNESAPIANRTIGFYLQPEMDLSMRDRGWICLGSGETDQNGVASLDIAVNVMGGRHALEARFAGDDDFKSCSNSTDFVVESPVPNLRLVNLEKNGSKVRFVLRVTDGYGFPLAGRVFAVDFLNVGQSSLNIISNQTGYVDISLNAGTAKSIDSRITVFKDEYTARLQTLARLNLNGSSSSFELSGDKGDQKLAENSVSGVSAGSALGVEGGNQVLSMPGVQVTVTPNPGKTDLPDRVKAKFSSYEPYDGVKFYYYLNGTTLKGVVTASVKVVLVHYPDVYRYDYSGELVWQPDYWGNYSFLVKAYDAYSTLVAQGSSSFSVQPAPANIVVYYPEAFSGSSQALTVAFSMSRTYDNGSGSSYFQTVRLAPTLTWDSVKYMLDKKTNSTVIHVYVNGSRVANVVPDSEGLCKAMVPLNFSGSFATMNVRVVTNETSRYREVAVERSFNLTRVSVTNTPSGGNDLFKFNYSLGISSDSERTYVGVDNPVKVSASLFDLPVYGIGVAFVGGRIGARSATNSSGWASVPSGYGLMRVKSACCLESDMASPLADIDGDGNVSVYDLTSMTARNGSVFGSPSYDWRFDLNADYQIDQTDLDIVESNYGKHVDYLGVGNYDYSSVNVDFDNGYRYCLDSQGIASVPTGAAWLNMSIGGIVEFFSWTLNKNNATDNAGTASEKWCPQQTGVYVLQVRLGPSSSTFNVTVALKSNVTQLNASLNNVNYYYVLKRPVNLTISLPSEMEVKVIPAEADSYVREASPDTNFGSNDFLYVGTEAFSFQYSSYIRFDISSIPENAHILSASLSVEGGYGGDAGLGYSVHKVTSQWGEMNITWNNRPGWAQVASCNFNFSFWDYLYDRIFLDVTEDVRLWQNGSASNYGWVLVDNGDAYGFLTLHSREFDHSWHPFLLIYYVMPTPVFTVTAFDSPVQVPLSGLPIELSANNVSIGNSVTNSSGVATIPWVPTGNRIYSIVATSCENATYEEGQATANVDFRPSTNITIFEEDIINITAGYQRHYDCALGLSSMDTEMSDLANLPVMIYVNGTYADGSIYNYSMQAMTGVNAGWFEFYWAAPQNGTYSIRVSFGGASEYKPCEDNITAFAVVTPLVVLFSVSPNEFEPNATLLLNATILDINTNARFTGYIVNVAFWNYSSDGSSSCLGSNGTTWGEDTLRIVYPDDGKAHAFTAKIIVDESMPQGIACNPVQLTVSKSTGITLNVTRDSSSSNHIIQGWLKWNNTGVDGTQVKIMVNDTEYLPSLTDVSGYFCLSLDLQPVNNQSTTYMITASFEDTSQEPLNCTAWAKTLDGQDYPVCTTVQYGYKPSTNYAIVTVEPQATLITADEDMSVSQANETTTQSSAQVPPQKTSEEMQKEAEQSGWLSIWHEFTWWYPWYRLHVKIDINPMIDIGFNPILPGGETWLWDGLEFFEGLTEEVISDILLDVGGLFGAYLVARKLSIVNPALGAVLELAKIAAQSILLYTSDWQTRGTRLLGASIGNIMMGLLAINMNIAETFVTALIRLCKWVSSAMMNLFTILMNILSVEQLISRWWMDVIEISGDFLLGGLGIIRYLGGI
jgi:hypothetical protein